MFDYLRWRGDLSFTQDTVNAVDALILSTLAYIHYGPSVENNPTRPIYLKDAAREFLSLSEQENRFRVKNDVELLQQAAETVRFGYCKICMYCDKLIPEQETQFAAMTFLLDDSTMFLAFRGTDYTLVGWKEDFNMSFQQTVPAQRLSVQYIREVSAEFSFPMRVGGHSKGGNLAVFGAARSSPMLQKRILEVYNHDGPGFNQYMMGDPGYLAIVPMIKTYIPQSSVIGMLLEHEEPYMVIRSKTVGLLQHDPYSWEVMGREFLPVEEVTQSSLFLDHTIKTWFSEMTNQERNQLVDVMFTLLGSGGVDKAVDIFQLKNIRVYLKAINSDENMRKILSSEFMNLLDAAQKTREKFESDKEKREDLDKLSSADA